MRCQARDLCAGSEPLGDIESKPQAGAAPASSAERKLTPAAERALAEAVARRAEIDRKTAERPKELSGRKGPEPTRYGDWEAKGIASDF
jgi:hypothetical protein